MRKVTLLLLTLIITVSALNTYAGEIKTDVSEQQKVVEILTYIDVPEENKELTRTQFCKMVCEITESEEPIASAIAFDDVDVNASGAGYIQKLYETGVISGDGSGSFYPDDKIKAVEAYSMLLKVLGYRELIKDARTETIISVAGDAGLTKNIGLTADEYITVENACKMIYNLLFADIMEFVYEDGGKYQKGEEYAEEILKIYSANGILEAADGYSLYDEKCGENNVVISGKTFIGNGRISADYIGMYGKYWYKDDAGDMKICGFIPKNNSTLKIMAEDIESYDNNVYTYRDENDKLKTAKLASGKDVIYNREQETDEKRMKPAYGQCTLIDNNDDGKYDVVMIYEYKNIYASYVNSVKESITYNVSAPNGTVKKELVLSDKDYVIYNEKGNEKQLNEITGNTLYTVMESKNNIVVWQCQKIVEGTVESIEDEYITVNGEKYKLADDVYKDGWNGTEFINVMLYFDMFGNIAAVKKSTNGGKWQYGYIIKRAYERNKSVIQIKMLCEDGKVKVLNTTDSKFKINDENKPLSENTAESIAAEQLIRYKTNKDGAITAIDTAEDRSSFDMTDAGGTDGNCLLKRADGKLLYKSSRKTFKKSAQYSAVTLNGEAFLDKDTILFNVPAAIDDETEDKDYYLRTSVPDNTQERITSYNTEASKIAADVIVIYNSQDGKTTKTSRTMAVKSVSKALYDGEEYDVLNGFYNGAKTSLKVDGSLAKITEKLKEGDFVRLGVKNDIVTEIEKLYTADGKGILNNNYYAGYAEYNSWYRYLIGHVSVMENEKMLLVYNDGTEDKSEFIRVEAFNIYVYDPNLPDNKRIYIGTDGDITDSRSDSINYDTVIVGQREAESHDMYIIKKKI